MLKGIGSRRYPLLSTEEEHKLFETIREAPDSTQAREARDRLVLSNMRFVIREAKIYLRRGMDFDDLISLGAEGLLIAIDRYSPDHDAKFLSYARHWVHFKMRRACDTQIRLVELPTHLIYAWTAISKIRRKLGKDATVTEIAKRYNHRGKSLKHKEGTVRKILELERDGQFHWPERLRRLAYHDAKRTVEGRVVKPRDFALRRDLERALERLPKKQRTTIYYRVIEEETLEEVGRRLGVCRERVRQLEQEGLEKIKRILKLDNKNKYDYSGGR